MSITQELINIVKSEIEDMGYEFVDLKYGKKGSRWFLQVFADKEGGITIDDLGSISRHLNYEFDRHPDILEHSYSLEVSSPGLDRQLKTKEDFEKCMNKDIKLITIDNSQVWEGKVLEVNEGNIIIRDREGIHKVVPVDNIAKASLKVKI